MKRLTRRETQWAIEKLSDSLQVDMTGAKVLRIDVAADLVMRETPRNYLALLQSSGRYKRYEIDDGATVGFKLERREMCFYDKNLERRRKHQSVMNLLKNRNVLRYELRYRKRIQEQFKMEAVTCMMLYDAVFYSKLIAGWKNEYASVRKRKDERYEMKDVTDTRLLKNILASIGMASLGGEQAVLKMLRLDDGAMTKMQRSRIQATVRELAENNRVFAENELITELDRKVHDAAAFSR